MDNKKWRRIGVALWTAATLFLASGPAKANSKEQEAYLNFETFCISNPGSGIDPASSLKQMAIQLPDEQANAILAPQTGKVFLVRSESGDVLVFLTDVVCGVYSRDADADRTLALALKYLRTSLLASENEGSETYRYFAISFDGPKGTFHGVMVVNNSKEMPGVRLELMQEPALRKQGITIPPWP